MSFDADTNAELQELLNALCEGQPTADMLSRMETLVLGDTEACDYYIRYLQLHGSLMLETAPLEPSAGQSGLVLDDPLPTRESPRSPVLGFLGDIGRQGWGYVADHSTLFSVLAAMIGVAVLTALAMRNGDLGRQNNAAKSEIAELKKDEGGRMKDEGKSEIGNPEVASSSLHPLSSFPARLVRSKDCRWNGQSPAPQIGQALPAGRSLSLASGMAEIDFDIGAKVILQSPASLQLLSGNSVKLEMGKATVEIKTIAARGFQVLTPGATYVDQGTEFGVQVSPGGNSKIHVFKGLVDIDLKGREGRAAPAPCRLAANYGARLEQGTETMTLVEDTGESFIRSMDEAERDRHVVAYWRFEDRPVGTLLPHTQNNTRPVCATVDSSFNGNDLYTYMVGCEPTFSSGVPIGTVPQSGCVNRSCLDCVQPHWPDVYTHSKFSHAAPLDIQKIAPAQWTIEASVKVAELTGRAQGFLGRDAAFTLDADRPPARLIFQINAQNHFAIGFYDAQCRFHEAVAKDLAVEPGRWYHLASVSDGRTLRLFVDALDGGGYQQRAECELPATGSTAMGKGQDNAEWSIGRAGNMGDSSTWLRFQGWIDEVRISDVARGPADFLFAPKGKMEDNGVGMR